MALIDEEQSTEEVLTNVADAVVEKKDTKIWKHEQIRQLKNEKCETQTLARLISKIIREKPIGWEKVTNTLLKQITRG